MHAENIYVIAPTEVKSEKKIRYAAYVRVSSGSEEQLHSYAGQISHYTRMFDENSDSELVGIYADAAISGTLSDERDEFNRMILDCQKGKIDKIITKNFTRFSRDIITTIKTVRELKTIGVSVFFEDDNFDSASMKSEFLLSLQGMMSQQGSKTISDNVRKGFVIRAKQGKFTPSNRTYGYKLIDKKLVPNPIESVVVNRIFNDYLNGKSLTLIARNLTEEKIPTPNEYEKWNHNVVRNILSNERAIGDTLLQKKYSTDTFPIKKKINYGEKDKYYISNSHEPIVSRDVFCKVQELLKEKSDRFYHVGKSYGNHTFSRKIFCGDCGRTFRRKIINSKIYWSCNGRDKGETDCEILQIPETEIKRIFMKMYRKLSLGKEKILVPTLEMLADLNAVKSKNNEKLLEINAELDEVAKENNMLYSLRAKEIITEEYFIEKKNMFAAKYENLKKSRKQILKYECEDDTLFNTKMLISALENTADLSEEFDAIKFKSIVKKITVKKSDEIIFTLINGLEISEKIERS